MSVLRGMIHARTFTEILGQEPTSPMPMIMFYPAGDGFQDCEFMAAVLLPAEEYDALEVERDKLSDRELCICGKPMDENNECMYCKYAMLEAGLNALSAERDALKSELEAAKAKPEFSIKCCIPNSSLRSLLKGEKCAVHIWGNDKAKGKIFSATDVLLIPGTNDMQADREGN